MGKKIIFALMFLFLFNFVYAFDFTKGTQFDFPTNDLGDLDDVEILSPENSQVVIYNDTSKTWYNSYLNDSAHHVNASDYWITGDHGSLRNIADILHNWLDSTSLFWSNSGHTIDELFDAPFGINTTTLYATDSIDFDLLGNAGAFSRANMIVDLARVNEVSGLVAGDPVYINGVTGDKPQIGLASNLYHNKSHVFGLVLDSGSDGNLVRVQTFGELRDINTSAYSTGLLHLGDGIIQNAIPMIGSHVHVGWATKINENSGIIEVEPDQYMHDVQGVSDENISIGGYGINFENYSGDIIGFMDMNSNVFNWDGNINSTWFNGKFNWTTLDPMLEFDGSSLDLNRLEFNDSVKILFADEQVVYNATSIETIFGTLDSGNLASVNILGDGDSYNVSELSGADPLTIQINFTDVVNFNVVALRGLYNGGSGHSLEIQLWRVGVGWETREELTDQMVFGVSTFDVFIGSDFIDGGLVRMRINHDNNGIPDHDYNLDAVFLGQVTGIVSGGDLGDLTGRGDACELLPDVFCKDGSKNMTGNLNGGGNNATNFNYLQSTIFNNTGNATFGDRVGFGVADPDSKVEIVAVGEAGFKVTKTGTDNSQAFQSSFVTTGTTATSYTGVSTVASMRGILDSSADINLVGFDGQFGLRNSYYDFDQANAGAYSSRFFLSTAGTGSNNFTNAGVMQLRVSGFDNTVEDFLFAENFVLLDIFDIGVSTTYGVNFTNAGGFKVAKMTDDDNNIENLFGGWFAGDGEGADLHFGTEHDGNIFWDGTNLVFNTTRVSSGDAWFSRNVSATGFITRTSVFDKSQNTKDFVKDSDFYLDSETGEIDHKKFYGYTPYEVTDYNNCWNVSVAYEYYRYDDDGLRVSYSELKDIPESDGFDYKFKNHTREECGKKMEEGVMLDKEIDVLRQSVYELGRELCLMGRTQWC